MDTNYYELHVTVLPERVLEFASFCEKIKAKPLYIQLSNGPHKDQLMLAANHMLKNDKEARAWTTDYSSMVRNHFEVSRIKLESRLTDGPNTYYEAHWKLDLKQNIPSPANWSRHIHWFVKNNPQILWSRSLFDTRIHYLSQRIYDSSDYVNASVVFNDSGEKISSEGLPLIKTHYERALYDSNPEIDNGWVVC
jgi:hypothetical protein